MGTVATEIRIKTFQTIVAAVRQPKRKIGDRWVQNAGVLKRRELNRK